MINKRYSGAEMLRNQILEIAPPTWSCDIAPSDYFYIIQVRNDDDVLLSLIVDNDNGTYDYAYRFGPECGTPSMAREPHVKDGLTDDLKSFLSMKRHSDAVALREKILSIAPTTWSCDITMSEDFEYMLEVYDKRSNDVVVVLGIDNDDGRYDYAYRHNTEHFIPGLASEPHVGADLPPDLYCFVRLSLDYQQLPETHHE